MFFIEGKKNFEFYFSQFFSNQNGRPLKLARNYYTTFNLDSFTYITQLHSKHILQNLTKTMETTDLLDIYPDAPFGFIAIDRPTSIKNYLCTR